MEIGDDVSDSDREAATLGIEAMHDYADSLGAVSEIEGEISFYVYQNLDELARAFARVTGMSEEDARDDWVGRSGDYHFSYQMGIGRVFVYTLGDYYAIRDSERRIEVFAEYLYEAYRGKIRERSASCHLEYAPQWLWDGARKFALERALATDAASYDDERERIARWARSQDTPLREMETWWKTFSSLPPMMAAELLASRAGESALMRYYALFPQRGAFQTSFGMTLNEFYELFDAHKDAGFPKLAIPKTAPIPEPPPTVPESGSAAVALPYIAWEMGEGVLWEDNFYAVCGTRIMHDYATSLGMQEMKRTFTASVEYRYGSVSNVWGSAGRGIDITLLGLPHARIYSTLSAWAHELVHIFQYELAESWLQPMWLTEGAAEFLADRAMLNSGALHSAERKQVVERANRIDKPLRKLETFDEFLDIDDLTATHYPYAHMAAELLASRAGEGAILRYYALLTRETDWRGAFESAFGLTVDDFYVMFEAHRAAGFPALEIPASAP